MWTASCDYVQQLVAPTIRPPKKQEEEEEKDIHATSDGTNSSFHNHHNNNEFPNPHYFRYYDYIQRRLDLANWARPWQQRRLQRRRRQQQQQGRGQGQLQSQRQEQQPGVLWINFTHHLYPARHTDHDFWGLGRFGNEHWIGSHPALIPCDVSPVHFKAWMKQSYWEGPNFSWSMAPRRSLFSNPPGYLPHVSDTLIVQVIQQQPELRRNEYVLLAGSLYRWIGLYNQTPPPYSWVWSFFPDADYWQEQIPTIRSNLLPLIITRQSSTL